MHAIVHSRPRFNLRLTRNLALIKKKQQPIRDHLLRWLKNTQRLVLLAEECEDEIARRCEHLENDLNIERSQHQSCIKDYNRLEQRYENLKVC